MSGKRSCDGSKHRFKREGRYDEEMGKRCNEGGTFRSIESPDANIRERLFAETLYINDHDQYTWSGVSSPESRSQLVNFPTVYRQDHEDPRISSPPLWHLGYGYDQAPRTRDDLTTAANINHFMRHLNQNQNPDGARDCDRCLRSSHGTRACSEHKKKGNLKKSKDQEDEQNSEEMRNSEDHIDREP